MKGIKKMKEKEIEDLKSQIEELQNAIDVLQERLQVEDTRLIKNSANVVISRVVHVIEDHSVVGYKEESREEFVMDLDSPEFITYGFSNGYSNTNSDIHQYHDVCILIPGLYKSIDKTEVKGIYIKFPRVMTNGFLLDSQHETIVKLKQLFGMIARIRMDKLVIGITIHIYPDEEKIDFCFDRKTEPYSTGVVFRETAVEVTVVDKVKD